MRTLKLVLLLVLGVFSPCAQAAIKVAYCAPGQTDVMTPECEQRIVIGGFLDDFFKHAGSNNFDVVGKAVRRCIISQMLSGAWSFDSNDKRVNFSRWKPVDIYIGSQCEDYVERTDRRQIMVRVDFYASGANASKSFLLPRLDEACSWLVDRILEMSRLPADEEKRMRKFFADRKSFLYSYYLSPGIIGHYCDNGVDARMPFALENWKKSQFNPLMATRVVDASYLLVQDHRRLQKYSKDKVLALGMHALEELIGRVDPLDEDIIKPFVFHYRKEVLKLMDEVEKRCGRSAVEDLEDNVLSGELDLESTDEALSLTKKVSACEAEKIRASVKRLREWCRNGYEIPPPNPAEAEEVVRYTTGGGEHPLLVRHKITAAASRKDVAFLRSHLNDVFRQNRAYALTKLAEVDPEGAYPYVLKAMEDCHTWARLYASIELAKTAKAKDVDIIRKFLSQETNRCVKLYLADALARAEGKPLPPPRPAAHEFPRDRTLIWLCGGNGELTDQTPWEAYYTCALPNLKPSDAVRRAYESGKIFISRPTPIGEGGLVVADPGSADTFWTTLERQLPDECLAYQDGFVYGEESMSMSASAAWPHAWRVFCEEAGIDPKPIAGNIKNLTNIQRRQYDDWGTRVAIEGFNVLYDFTHDYFGKLKPGVKVATYMCRQCGTMGPYARKWKFDISAGYVYGTGPTKRPRERNRYAYSEIRKLKTLWPERPCQWLSWGTPVHPEVGELQAKLDDQARKAGRSPMSLPCYRQIWEQQPYFRRWEEAYSANITSWQAGAMPGYFASYSTKCKKGGGSCVYLDTEGVYPGYMSKSLEDGIRYAFRDTLIDYRDMLSKRDSPSVSDDDLDTESVELEEDGGKGDPAYQRQQEDIAKFRQGYMNAFRFMYDTARTQVGMPYYEPQDFKSLLMLTGKGGGTECAASQWMDGFDVVDDASIPVAMGTLSRYHFIAVTDVDGKGTRMDESTRRAFLSWLKEQQGVLWVEGWLGENPRYTFECPEGDLRTPWPWTPSVTNNAEVITVWKDPAYKAIVIFEKRQAKVTDEPIVRGGKVLREFFAGNGIDFQFPKAPGMISTRVGKFEVHALSQRSSYKGRVEGVELLTGEKDPMLTIDNEDAFAMVVKNDWIRPWVAVHDGVRVLAGNRFERVEAIPGGLRVKGVRGPFGEPSALPNKVIRLHREGDSMLFKRSSK